MSAPAQVWLVVESWEGTGEDPVAWVEAYASQEAATKAVERSCKDVYESFALDEPDVYAAWSGLTWAWDVDATRGESTCEELGSTYAVTRATLKG